MQKSSLSGVNGSYDAQNVPDGRMELTEGSKKYRFFCKSIPATLPTLFGQQTPGLER